MDRGTEIQVRKEVKMPSIFKALATITVWILFVLGCIGVLFVCGGIAHSVGGTPLIIGAWIASILSLILAVVAMKLRKMLE
jgi:amino acid transporter